MNNRRLDIERPYQQGDPLDMDDAREASRRSSEMRREAEEALRQAVERRAEAEAEYRKRLAVAIVHKRQEAPATVAKDLAHGEPEVSEAMVAFRIAEGMVDAAKERLRTIEGDRSQLRGLIDFSAGVAAALRDQDDRPATKTYGGRR